MKERRCRAWARQGKWGNLQFPDHLLCFASILLWWLFSLQVLSNSFGTQWTVAFKAPLSVRFPRQDCQSRLPFPSLGEPSQPNDLTCIPCIGRRSSLTLSHQESLSASLGTCIFRYIQVYIYTIYFAFPNPTKYMLSSLLYI